VITCDFPFTYVWVDNHVTMHQSIHQQARQAELLSAQHKTQTCKDAPMAQQASRLEVHSPRGTDRANLPLAPIRILASSLAIAAHVALVWPCLHCARE
jgi:hypothetical protein